MVQFFNKKQKHILFVSFLYLLWLCLYLIILIISYFKPLAPFAIFSEGPSLRMRSPHAHETSFSSDLQWIREAVEDHLKADEMQICWHHFMVSLVSSAPFHDCCCSYDDGHQRLRLPFYAASFKTATTTRRMISITI